MSVKSKLRTWRIDFPPVYSQLNGSVIRNGSTLTIPAGQKIDTEEHAFPPPKGMAGDFGGPFRSVRVDVDRPSAYLNLKERFFNLRDLKYSGPMVTPMGGFTQSDASFIDLSLPSNPTAAMTSKGTTAIALCAPNNPHAHVATGIGELLKDGLPALPGIRTWKSRTLGLKEVGDEYLNYEFGWRPLHEEVKEVSSSIAKSHQILSQYHRDEGRNVRRRFAFEPVTSTSTEKIEGQTAEYGGGSQFIDTSNKGTLTRTVESTTRQWFSGSFTYATPRIDSVSKLMGAGSNAQQLLGTTLTPDLLWELTPWSWAIDWFSNAGDVIHNVTLMKQLGLVLRYGYMMEETISKVTYSMDKSGIYGHPAPPPPASITKVVKNRCRANPFGFGIGWEGLSPTQLAITAALGITRVL